MTTVCSATLLVVIVSCQTTSAAGPPRIVSSQKTLRKSVASGEPLELWCPVASDSPVFFDWKKDSDEIHVGWERYRLQSDDTILTVRDTEPADSGVYQCTAVNGFGSVDFQYTVTVTPSADVNESLVAVDTSSADRGPSFKGLKRMQQHQHVIQPVGSTVRFLCRADGHPRPTVVWFKDGHIVITSSSSDDDTRGFTLKLSAVTTRDNGRYMCRVSNIVSAINFTYTLEVTDVPSVQLFMNTTVNYMEQAAFRCYVRCDVEPMIQWLKRVDASSNSTIEVSNEHYVVLSGGSLLARTNGTYVSRLTIHNTTQTQAGLYVCLATNTLGYNYASAYLTVLAPLDFGINFHDTKDSTLNSPLIVSLLVTLSVIFFVVIVVYVLARYRQRYRMHAVPAAGHNTFAAHRQPQHHYRVPVDQCRVVSSKPS